MVYARIGKLLRRRAVAVFMSAAVSLSACQTAVADADRTAGTVQAWGGNIFGQLGNGTNVNQNTPVPVCAVSQTAPCARHLTHVSAISAGGLHSLALLKDGTVVAWGLNDFGQLGDGTNTNRNTPVRVCAIDQTAPCTRHLTNVVAISGGDAHSLALLKDGTVVAWGRGELGDGTNTNRNTPVRVCAIGQTAPCTRHLTHVRAISAGGLHSLALLRDGAALAWGRNVEGELGDGTNTNRRTPVRVCAIGQTAPCT
ncbi:RCC1 domain-containing protein, partial [Streptomyces sp. NPDC001635]